MKWGVGGLNIKACRVGDTEITINCYKNVDPLTNLRLKTQKGNDYDSVTVKGRWPANFIHDGSAEVLALLPNTPAQKQER